MALAVALVLVLVAVLVMWISIAREPGPSAQDAATAYELAWHRHDLDTLYDLSDATLRDGLDRAAFIAAQREVFGPSSEQTEPVAVRVEAVECHDGVARVQTRVSSADGDVRNELRLVRRHRRWSVVAYTLVPEGNR